MLWIAADEHAYRTFLKHTCAATSLNNNTANMYFILLKWTFLHIFKKQFDTCFALYKLLIYILYLEKAKLLTLIWKYIEKHHWINQVLILDSAAVYHFFKVFNNHFKHFLASLAYFTHYKLSTIHSFKWALKNSMHNW